MRAKDRLVKIAARVLRRVRRTQSPPDEYSRLALTVAQDGSTWTITAVTGPALDVRQLLLRTPDGTRTRLGDFARTVTGGRATHVASVDITTIYDASRGALDPGADAFTDRTASLDLVVFDDRERTPKFATRIPQAELADYWDAGGAESTGGTDGPTAGYFAPLGRFRATELTGFAAVTLPDGTVAHPRLTGFGHVTMVVGPAPPPVTVVTEVVRAAAGRLYLAGTVQLGAYPAADASLVILGRHHPLHQGRPVSLTHSPELAVAERAGNGRRRHRFEVEVDLAELIADPPGMPPHALADLWLEVTDTAGGPSARGRVGRVPYEQRVALAETSTRVGDVGLQVLPYLTAKKGNVSLILEQLPAAALDALTETAKAPRAERPVWLIGERPDTAQDNGLHLFRYLRSRRRDIDAYYVITADSPDRKNLAGLDHVIDFGSSTHVDVTRRADRIVSTHHPDYLFPTRSPQFAASITAPRVFLQHGVMGTKWMVPTYGKFGTDFTADLVCVSSAREREYLIHDFGYHPDEVQVTGLARFDALFAGEVDPVPNQVLVMPTWREWLPNEEAFADSEYLRQWRGLLEDPRLAALRESAGARIKFYLHTNMRAYADYFALEGVEFVAHGEQSVQELLQESSVLVTDYSSPGFDFSFLGRPVIYFQFDRAQFLGRSGSHLMLDEELPGFISTGRDGVLKRLAAVLAPGFVLEDDYLRRAARFLAHRDRDNCARIVTAVQGARRGRVFATSLRGSTFGRTVATRLRRSKAYFPFWRFVFRLLSLLPAREAIVFESGVGKQFADSPRAIYDELVRRGDPRPRVWILPRTVPVDDPQLTVVARFSPRYFYHLARAKYWVNNQNFPHYIRRRRRGVFVQTWHGTPLKRMLHDLDRIVGRDEGYVRRVSTAVDQWSVLLSPSPYATTAFRSAFRYDGPVAELGYPRNDILFGPDTAAIRARTRARFGIRDDQRVILYAPTFRDDQKRGSRFTFELPLDLARFAAECGGDSVLLLRMHMLVSDAVQIPAAAAHCVQDVSDHTDIAELYLAADTLVTDYSSVMFDFALTGSPMVFYPYDLATYRDEVRGFYLDYEATVPGPIARSEDELFAALRATAVPTEDQLDRIRDFAGRYAPHDDGRAAARVVEELL